MCRHHAASLPCRKHVHQQLEQGWAVVQQRINHAAAVRICDETLQMH